MAPPFALVAHIVERPMMGSTERHRPLVARFAPHRAGLHQSNMMRLTGCPAADKAGQRRHMAQVRLIPDPTRLRQRQDRFFYLSCFATPIGRGPAVSWDGQKVLPPLLEQGRKNLRIMSALR